MMPSPQRQPSDDLPWSIEACNKRILMEASNMYLNRMDLWEVRHVTDRDRRTERAKKTASGYFKCRQIAALIDGLTD
jgi:hypothetical protein